MIPRFYSATPLAGESIVLSGAEAHHLLHVRRAKVGEHIVLFDGSGVEFRARIAACSRQVLQLELLEGRQVDRESKVRLTLGMALPKGDRQRFLVEKCVELGVHALRPLTTDHSVSRPAAGALDRLRRTVVEASKQCGRNQLMAIEPPCSIRDWLAEVSTGEARWLGHPGGRALGELAVNPLATRTPVRAVIGPEGGLTDGEVEFARQAGWQLIDLGPRILRVETAALAVAAWVSLSSG